jgi:hypothetical protein
VTCNGAIVAGFDVLEETPLTGVWLAVAAVVALVAALALTLYFFYGGQ